MRKNPGLYTFPWIALILLTLDVAVGTEENVTSSIQASARTDEGGGETIQALESSIAIPLRRHRQPSRPKSRGEIDCDFYDENLCLHVRKYPDKAIAFQLMKFSRNRPKSGLNITRKFHGNRRTGENDARKDGPGSDSVFLCPSEIDYVRPKRGRSVSGEWKDIVNVEDYTQTLRMERCLQPLGSCSYVSHHFKSECSQVYNYHRLLSWNKARGLHMDIYKVPTCCSCSMKGYSYLYPPLRGFQNRPRREQAFGEPRSPASKNLLQSENLLPKRRLGALSRESDNAVPASLSPNTRSPSASFLRDRRDNGDQESGSVNYDYHPIIGFF